jgi:DNA-binding beta-propeller fold protein YncE
MLAYDRKGFWPTGRAPKEPPGTARTLCSPLVAVFVATCLLAMVTCGCSVNVDWGEDKQGGTIPSLNGEDSTSTTAAGGVTGGTTATTVAAETLFTRVSREEVQRRLALPPFAYVSEMDTGGGWQFVGKIAYVDALANRVAHRPRAGIQPVGIAVNPDGTVFYVSDTYKPVVHIMDCETHEKKGEIVLPGIEPTDVLSWSRKVAEGPVSYQEVGGCTGALAVTPDGEKLLVCTKAGLQIVDLGTGLSERTLADVHGFKVAVSFDGTRAYVATHDWFTREARRLEEWFALTEEGVGGSLTVLDTSSWQIVASRECGLAGGLAVQPDDSLLHLSDLTEDALRVIDAQTLADVALVPVGKSKPTGVGVLPDGSKVYVVCAGEARVAGNAPLTTERIGASGEWFCAVITTDDFTIRKKIPLDMY